MLQMHCSTLQLHFIAFGGEEVISIFSQLTYKAPDFWIVRQSKRGYCFPESWVLWELHSSSNPSGEVFLVLGPARLQGNNLIIGRCEQLTLLEKNTDQNKRGAPASLQILFLLQEERWTFSGWHLATTEPTNQNPPDGVWGDQIQPIQFRLLVSQSGRPWLCTNFSASFLQFFSPLLESVVML